nr:hypothetical protein [Tanacetum cinerariifolium]
QEDLGTRIDPGSHKESLEAKKVAQYVSVDEEVEEESAEAALLRRKGKDINTIAKMIEETLKVVVPKMVNETTDQNMKDNLPMVVSEGIKLEGEKTKDDIALMIDDAVRKEQEHTRAKLSFKVSNDVASNVLLVDAFYKQDHEDHHDDDALPEGESSTKRLGTEEQEEFDAYVKDQELMLFSKKIMKTIMMMMFVMMGRAVRKDKERLRKVKDQDIDNDEVPSKEESSELRTKMSGNGMKVHYYQLGFESYQLKVNLTAPKLTLPGIKEMKPYTITSFTFVGLIYENNKKKKSIMDIDEIQKFRDATLKRILKEVKKINLDVKHGYAYPTLSKDDAEFRVFYEEYIKERLRNQDQMRRLGVDPKL